MKKKRLIYLTGVFCLLLCACGQTQPGDTGREEGGVPLENGSRSGQADEVESGAEGSQAEGAEGAQQGGQAEGADGAQQGGQADGVENAQNGTGEQDWAACFQNMKYTKSDKGISDTNPVMTQRFGADPYGMVYEDRVYLYMTADALERDADGQVTENTYSKIRSINVISTDDMVNFTDHGSVAAAGPEGAAKWAHNSWAPAAAWKEIDGKVKFFLYFADNGGGIGVLESDSPTGPFTDPLGEALISRKTPNCADVTWLFDPAVLVDDDGRAYLYFGGGIPEGRIADPGTARVVELGEDMISIKGEPRVLDVPYLFEDSGIHKAGDKYYYTYCSNWQVDDEGTARWGFRSAEIVSMEGDSPMGPFTVKERILENPGKYCGLYGNNHHCVFSFQDRWYIAYHTRVLEKAMGLEKGYRCTQLEEFAMGEDGTIGTIPQTMTGREQLKYVDAYADNSGVNMAVQAGLDTVCLEDGQTMVLTGIDSGDYMKVQGVDFGEEPAVGVEILLRKVSESEEPCVIQVKTDALFGDIAGYVPVEQQGDAEDGFYRCRIALEQELTGVHDVYFVFCGSGYEVKSWRFER
ncbi:MAG: glycoside hydrolase family 43 protein [Acetatifactor sp.]|nr:glycoside hydrolase family 43 protein [Acetatifactor sp.]